MFLQYSENGLKVPKYTIKARDGVVVLERVVPGGGGTRDRPPWLRDGQRRVPTFLLALLGPLVAAYVTTA